MTRHEERIKAMTLLYQKDIRPDLNIEPFMEGFDLFNGVITHLESVDQVIKDNLKNYTIERLSMIDRAIIRLAVYEMMYVDLPKPIIINEAIKLTKAYSNLEDEKQSAFTNRLLDNISKRLG